VRRNLPSGSVLAHLGLEPFVVGGKQPVGIVPLLKPRYRAVTSSEQALQPCAARHVDTNTAHAPSEAD
jgi:hypothetical protein